MVRLLILAVIVLLSIGLAHWASTKILYQVDVVSFSWGLGVAALTAWAWMMLHGWWSAVTKPFKPLKVTLETKETPAQVNFASILAIAEGIVFIGIVIAAVIMIIANS
jgi:hypothetical protein